MKYATPGWYKNRNIDYGEITDQQLADASNIAARMEADNLKLYREKATAQWALAAQAREIWGETTHIARYIMRQPIEKPPDLTKALLHLNRLVVQARRTARQKAKRQSYAKTYRQRQKRLFRDLRDAAILEGDQYGNILYGVDDD